MSNSPKTVKLPRVRRGKELEDMFDLTHKMYVQMRTAKVVKNPVEWKYTGPQAFDRMKHNTGSDLVAKTNTGRHLIMSRSDIDYAGVAKGIGVAFDAKQTSGKSLPLANIHEHQLKTLLEYQRAGGIAGFMVYFSELERLFFLQASYVDKCFVTMKYQNTRKSIPLSDCEAHGREIPVNKFAKTADWVKVLIQ